MLSSGGLQFTAVNSICAYHTLQWINMADGVPILSNEPVDKQHNDTYKSFK